MLVEIEMPVLPGTTVYVVRICTCGISYRSRCAQYSGRPTGNSRGLAVIPAKPDLKNTRKACCFKIIPNKFNPQKHLHKWGKTVFGSYAEAEAYVRTKI